MTAPLTGYTASLPSDIVLDSGVLYVGNTVLGAFRGGLKFDPGPLYRQVAFDGQRSPVRRLNRVTMRMPRITGTAIQLATTNVGQIEPGASVATTGAWTGSTSYAPKVAGPQLAAGDYLTDVRLVYQRGGSTSAAGSYVQLRFPAALCTKYTIVGQDGGELAVALEIEARLDPALSGFSNIGAAPFRIEYLATGGFPITDGLLIHLDASNVVSYPGTGATWKNLVDGQSTYDATWTALNGAVLPPWVSNGNASYFQCSMAAQNQVQSANITGLDLRQDFTLELWVRYRTVQSHDLFGQGTTTTNNGLNIYESGSQFANNGNKNFTMYNNDYSISAGVYSNAWKQLVFSYDHQSPYTKTMYQNGTKLGNSTTGQSAYTGTGTFRIGQPYSNAPGAFSTDKDIAIARVYTRTLTDAEVLTSYNFDKARFGL